MNKPMTVKQLLKFCEEEVKNGHGDCSIMLSDDDEGNGYHYCWYSFSHTTEEELGESIDEFIDEEIAPKNKTIILG